MCHKSCLLYTSDAADDLLCVDLGGRRIIKKKGIDSILKIWVGRDLDMTLENHLKKELGFGKQF